MNINIIKAGNRYLSLLIEMNKQLMEDEKFDRPLTDEKLNERWNFFLSESKYKVMCFQIDSDIVGYAIIEIDREPLYLRHFFIKREFRRKGYGTECFSKMIACLETSQIDLDVMSWNERGYNFWLSLGFKERCKIMTYNKIDEISSN